MNSGVKLWKQRHSCRGTLHDDDVYIVLMSFISEDSCMLSVVCTVRRTLKSGLTQEELAVVLAAP